MKAIGAAVFGVAFVLLVALYGTFATGFCLSKLWLWYAVPIGFPVISWKAFGVFAQALYVLRPASSSHTDKNVAAILFAFPWLTLLIGWVLL